MTVSARSAKNRAEAAAAEATTFVDMRAGAPVRAGTFTYDGPDIETPWHAHDLHQLEYAFEGFAEVRTATTHHLLPPRQAVWIPAGITHHTSLRGVRSIAVFFDPNAIPAAGDHVRVLAVTPLLREMIVYASRWPIARPTTDPIADAFFTALALLVAEWLEHDAPLALPTTTDPTMRAVMEFTNAHLDDITAAAVSQAAGISPRTLRRQFPASTGMSWREYLTHARLLRAMALLTDQQRTVLDVATAVGFDSVSAFTRAFRQVTGETPTQYRARVRPDRRPG